MESGQIRYNEQVKIYYVYIKNFSFRHVWYGQTERLWSRWGPWTISKSRSNSAHPCKNWNSYGMMHSAIILEVYFSFYFHKIFILWNFCHKPYFVKIPRINKILEHPQPMFFLISCISVSCKMTYLKRANDYNAVGRWSFYDELCQIKVQIQGLEESIENRYAHNTGKNRKISLKVGKYESF